MVSEADVGGDSRGDEQCFRRKFSNGVRGRIQLVKGSGVAGLRIEMRGMAMSAAPSNQGSSSLTPASSAGVSSFALRVGGSVAGHGRASRLTILAACERTCRRCLTASLGREMFTNWKSGILVGLVMLDGDGCDLPGLSRPLASLWCEGGAALRHAKHHMRCGIGLLTTGWAQTPGRPAVRTGVGLGPEVARARGAP